MRQAHPPRKAACKPMLTATSICPEHGENFLPGGGFILGIDGGGTKTMVGAKHVYGREVLYRRFGPLNMNGNGREHVVQTLSDIFRWTKQVGGGLAHCRAVCMGAAGISADGQRSFLQHAFQAAGYAGPLSILGDHEIALRGAVGCGPGILLLSGTGSICYGKNVKGSTARAGGWGYQISDEGSGYAIGRDILAAIGRQYDGTGPATGLAPLVYTQLGVENGQFEQVVDRLYAAQDTKRFVASFARLLDKLPAGEDSVATDILERNAHALVRLCTSVANRLSFKDGLLAFGGSLLLCDTQLRHLTEALLNTEGFCFKLCAPLNSPVDCAVLTAESMGHS